MKCFDHLCSLMFKKVTHSLFKNTPHTNIADILLFLSPLKLLKDCAAFQMIFICSLFSTATTCTLRHQRKNNVDKWENSGHSSPSVYGKTSQREMVPPVPRCRTGTLSDLSLLWGRTLIFASFSAAGDRIIFQPTVVSHFSAVRKHMATWTWLLWSKGWQWLASKEINICVFFIAAKQTGHFYSN